MAEKNKMLLEAEVLYENGCYSEATSKCIEVIKSGENLKEAYTLWSKAYLMLIPITKMEEYSKSFFDAITNAAQRCISFEDFFALEAEINSAFSKWHRYWDKFQLEFIAENPTLDNWKTYINTWVTPMFNRTQASIIVRNMPLFNALQEESGLDIDQLCEKYELPTENEYTDEEKNALRYKIGCKIFDDTVALHQNYKHTSSEALSSVSSELIGRLCLAPLVIDASIEEGDPSELERLLKYAEAVNYEMMAEVYPNGNRVVLFNDSTNSVAELKKTYARIKELDPSFVIPEIVTPAPMPVQNNTTGGNSGGGCYVATAVYGSYDCPQVWTLRRFRDDTLAETWYGRAFIKTYYAISPTLVKWFGDTDWFKKMWKGKLDRMVANLNNEGVKDTPYEDKKW